MDSLVFQNFPYYDMLISQELAILLADVTSNFISTGNYTVQDTVTPQAGEFITLHMMCEQRPSLLIDKCIHVFHFLFYANEMIIRRQDGSKKVRIFRPDRKAMSERELVDWLVAKGFSKERASPVIDMESDDDRFTKWSW